MFKLKKAAKKIVNLSYFFYGIIVVKIFTISTLLLGCTTAVHRAPVASLEQPPAWKINTHEVAKGETLYSIAWRYNLNVLELAQINSISETDTIYPGQILDLTTNRLVIEPTEKTGNSAGVTSRSKNKPSTPTTKVTTSPASQQLRWRWPASGTLLAKFSEAPALNRGIDIGAKKGEPVFATEAGTVVYAGSGLRGYGNLLIIKHTEEYLSAYAHNSVLRVAEGDRVKAGQRIADIGSSGTDRSKLHFEIRREGKPVDPLSLLPER